MKYPPYACPCCGYTNGDMLEDYIKQLREEFIEYQNKRVGIEK